MSERSVESSSDEKPPPCDLTVSEPRRVGNKLHTKATIVCRQDLDINWRLRITNHKGFFFDKVVGRNDGRDSLSAGKPVEVEIDDGECLNGTNKYFAKISVQGIETFSATKALRNPKEKDYYVNIRCPKQ